MENRDLRQEFWENGYVVVENFFTDAELADMEEVMVKYLSLTESQMEESGKGITPVLVNDNFQKYVADTFNFGQQALTEPAFIAFNQHEAMNELTQAIMGDFAAEYLLVQISTRGRGQSWHRDCHYPDQPGHYMVNRLIYTRDIIPETGALYVVPGSHKLDKLPPGEPHAPIEGEVMIAPKKGTFVFLHSSTFHRVIPNATDNPRFSINFRVRPADAPAGLGDIAHFRNGIYKFSEQKEIAKN